MRNILVLALAAAPLAAEEPAPALAAVTAELVAAIENRLPAEAASAVARVPPAYAKGTQDEQKQALAAVGRAAREEDLRVRHGAFAALAAMKAKGSSKHLMKWLDPPREFKGESPASYVEAIRAAGEIADPPTLDRLEKLGDHGVLEIAAAATESLGGFRDLPVGRKKSLAFDLVDRLKGLSGRSRREGRDEQIYARKAQLALSTKTALQRLTGLAYESADGWSDWKERSKNKRDPFS
ncbi:MAG: hypothetical protein ACREID_01275 [Planctomycetota bacterium]